MLQDERWRRDWVSDDAISEQTLTRDLLEDLAERMNIAEGDLRAQSRRIDHVEAELDVRREAHRANRVLAYAALAGVAVLYAIGIGLVLRAIGI
jgi:hypothetical protein